MSYILDALRRAEADRERERGQVPGLHTQPLSGSDAAPAAGPRRWLPWAGGGLLLLAGIGTGIWMTSGSPEAVAPAPLPAALPTPQPAPAPPSTPTPVSTPLPQPAASEASPYLPPAPPPAAVVAPPAAVAEAPIPRLADLPESTRRELPKLAISGSVYSDDPASRFVIVNGEVLREGAKLGADLVLEQIGARELVLRFKGQRYRLPV
ncbi:general secretion pathway protein GspB [Roseateles sp. LYH14W]|uniref:General secretion pathway protein GspB n=1 Tax=Pelomonas parva TaxID=3299032 RepID=A0ABW7F868_9BURK